MKQQYPVKLNCCWSNMKQRCYNPKAKAYSSYGGKGIQIEIKKNDLLILWHRDNAGNMDSPSIHRIDSSKNYTKENCQFIERALHWKIPESRWMKKYNMSCTDIIRFCGCCQSTVRNWEKRGLDVLKTASDFKNKTGIYECLKNIS